MPQPPPSPLDEAGFVVPYEMQVWRTFVEGGDLGRTLVRLCMLAAPAVSLSFVLDRGPGASVRVTFVIGGEPVEVVCGPDLAEEFATDGLALILRALNAALATHRIDKRFIVDLPDYRLAIVDPRAAVWAAQRSWLVEKCVEPAPDVTPEEPRSGGDLPTLPTPEQIVPPDRHFADDPSYPARLADYFLRLAAFAGVGPVTCEPTPSRNPMFRGEDFFSLRVTWSYPGGGSLQTTVRIRPGTRVPLQPICDEINRGLQSFSSPDGETASLFRAYLCTSTPLGEHVVLATDAEAARLRSHAYLIEPEPAAPSIEALANAGFELPYLWGFWQGWPSLDRVLIRTCLLARPHLALTFSTMREEDGVMSVRYQAGTASAAYRYPPGAEKEEVVNVLPRVFRDLNEFVGAQGMAQRFVMMKAEPHFHSPRVLLLDPVAIAAIWNAPGVYLGCLPPGTTGMPGPLPAPTRHPPREVAAPLDRIPRIAEIVGEKNMLESDFKCSSRESDYPSLVEEIAGFAKVRLSIAPLAVADENVYHYDIGVAHDGVAGVIRLENEKYARVAPIVDYLNPILAARGDARALYRFTGGSFESGILLATKEEADRLREAAYLVESGDDA